MPPKIQNIQNNNPLVNMPDDDSDNELQIDVAPKQVSQHVAPVASIANKPKRKYNLTDEHKEVLKQRLQVAHLRKKELADARQQEKQEAKNFLEEKKKQKILQEAEKLKKREEKMMNDLTVKEIVKPKKVIAPAPTPVVRNKKKVVLYVTDSEDDDDDEEEEIEIVKKIKQPKPRQQKR